MTSLLIKDVTSPLLSPVRPFAYMMSYSGGAHKATSHATVGLRRYSAGHTYR